MKKLPEVGDVLSHPQDAIYNRLVDEVRTIDIPAHVPGAVAHVVLGDAVIDEVLEHRRRELFERLARRTGGDTHTVTIHRFEDAAGPDFESRLGRAFAGSEFGSPGIVGDDVPLLGGRRGWATTITVHGPSKNRIRRALDAEFGTSIQHRGAP